MFNVTKSIEGQRKLCNEKGYPHFAPKNGICFDCKKQIYQEQKKVFRNLETNEVVREYTTGITVEKASTSLVTGCPHCNRSYCD
jgi:hypothetical protein